MQHYSLDLAQLIEQRNYNGIIALLISKIPLIVSAILILIIGFAVSNLIGRLVIKGLKAKGVDPSVHSFIRTCITLILKFAFILSAISTLGINVSSFLAAIGAAGITAGIGLQSSVGQLASGVQILINHPFKSGDYVELGTVSGKVHEIKLMYTVLITVDNKQVIIPNSTITSSNIINYNANNRRRLDLVYSVAYDQDIEKVRSAILETVKANKLIFNDPEPIIAVKEHGPSSINFACLIWCSSEDYWNVFYYMQEQVKLAFDKNGIEIPYSQLDVHINKEN
ncbi:MAG: mechanosensitive ion channel [Clostridia bacterium]|nr:mechanosensitive ion channel [Clostridia bacterium]